MSKTINKCCEYCGNNMEVKLSRIKMGGGKYCSLKCLGMSRRKKHYKKCDYCKKDFLSRYISQRFCSVSCYLRTRTKENNPNWNGGTRAKYLRRKNDLKYTLSHRIGNIIRHHLKRGYKKEFSTWENVLGYNFKQLKRHFRSTIPNGYSWVEFLNDELHIDHIIPRNEFEFTDSNDLQFKQCWDLKNLRLIPAKENLSKRDKVIEPYQTVMGLRYPTAAELKDWEESEQE